MRNFISNAEYQGSNIEELINAGFEEGSEFCTFKQAKTFYNLTGKELKGAKGCARLMKIVTKKVINKLTKKEETKKVPTYFTVFEKSHIESILTANGVGV
tara:strand:+ start:268 stop:567 length:300 start_codon:yes stop_codon:yes gene_type:complete